MNLAPVKTDMLLVVLDTPFDVNPCRENSLRRSPIALSAFSLIFCINDKIAVFVLMEGVRTLTVELLIKWGVNK
ncbi:hypothetical protein Q5705_12850 [Kosakonia sp. H02]|nr:hypothetical protein Q5705_12850 [Kosakonia sp. H02]